MFFLASTKLIISEKSDKIRKIRIILSGIQSYNLSIAGTESYTEKAAKSEASVSNGETNCSSEWEGFCLNEGTCVFKIDLNITTCRYVVYTAGPFLPNPRDYSCFITFSQKN